MGLVTFQSFRVEPVNRHTHSIHALRLGVSIYDLYFNDTRKVGTSTNGFDFQGRLMTVHLMIPHCIYI